MESAKLAGTRSRTKYDAAFRAEAIRRITQDGQAATHVAQALGMGEALLGRWVRTDWPPPQVAKLWSRKTSTCGPSWRVWKRSAIFKKSADNIFATDGPMKLFTFIALHAAYWPVRKQCQLLGVSPSSYCAWCKGFPTPAAEPSAAALQVAAQRVFTTHAGRYGQRRLRAQLRREGHAAGRYRLCECLIPNILRALCTRASTRLPRTTQADPQAVAAANKLATWPSATTPNQIWVGDST